MYYLHIHFPNHEKCFWAFMENGSLFASERADFASAFQPQYVEKLRQQVIKNWPKAECFPIECSSRQIIPENMRKIMNIA